MQPGKQGKFRKKRGKKHLAFTDPSVSPEKQFAFFPLHRLQGSPPAQASLA